VNTAGSSDADLWCRQFVQLVTAYVEDTLPEHMQASVDQHLSGCPGCRNVLAQWRTVISLAGQLTEADVDSTDDVTRDRLLSLFRGLRRR
jgi:anti-sigma factor RsiW